MKTPPPVLTRRRLAAELKSRAPEFPPELLRAALKEILDGLTEALAEERTVILRGFGRFEVRRYQGSAKRLGLVFRPSPALTVRLAEEDRG